MVRSIELGVCKVTFSHQYDSDIVKDKKRNITQVVRKPVSTTVSVEHGEERVSAKAMCSPKDHFNFEKGRKIGLSKCFAKMVTLQKSDRKRVWDEYNKLKTGGRW